MDIKQQIEIEIEKIRQMYLNSAEEIVSGYNRERDYSSDYEGRQLFELLQNADDAAEGAEGKVCISLEGNILTVSNTGTPFSLAGIKSLLYPNASPKRIHADKIGCKGLGFRSILTWAKSVRVATSEFTIEFSRQHAIDFFTSITNTPSLDTTSLKKEIALLSKERFPIATLRCPHIVYEIAVTQGFDTSIIIECKESLLEKIQNQIMALRFEEMIFLTKLHEVEILCKGCHKIFTKLTETDGSTVLISEEDRISGRISTTLWKLFKKKGEISDAGDQKRNYEFIIAYDKENRCSGEVLYSYFRTDVQLAFPALIHGTFELTSDRNSILKNSYVNEQLIDILADFMIESAIKLSEDKKTLDYEPLKLVIAPQVDTVLRTYGFDTKLKERALKAKLLPTIAQTYVSALSHPKYHKNSFDKVLNPEKFPELLLHCDDKYIEDFLIKEAELQPYSADELRERINEDLNSYTAEQKCEIIAQLRKEKKSVENLLLLEDSEGENVPANIQVYPQPENKDFIKLPKWVNIRFLNPEMERVLLDKLEISDRRSLVNALSGYNVSEYSFVRLISGIATQYDNLISSSKEKCCDILRWLWGYFRNSSSEDRLNDDRIRIKVLCRDGIIRPAKECFFGKEYDNSFGERIISTFSAAFVADYHSFKLGDTDKSGVMQFLEWIGVSEFPRLKSFRLNESEKNEYIEYCYSLNPQMICSNGRSYDKSRFPARNIDKVTVSKFEGIEKILQTSDFNDVLLWMLLDKEFQLAINSETETGVSVIQGSPTYMPDTLCTVMSRNMPSYMRYMLTEKLRWIRGKESLALPGECCFEDNVLGQYVTVPNIDFTYISRAARHNCQKDIVAMLSKLGVADRFQDLDKQLMFTVFEKLPEIDPKGLRAKSLYRRLREIDNSVESHPACKDFKKCGKVLVKFGGEKRYVPVSEAYYSDKRVYSKEILANFNMLDLDYRFGEQKVEALLGVKPLKNLEVKLESEPALHPADRNFKSEYADFLPFVYACRINNTKDEFRILKNTVISVCTEAKISFALDDKKHICSLNNYETVYLKGDRKKAYICVKDPGLTLPELMRDIRFSDAVAEVISAILNIHEEKTFYRDLFKSDVAAREYMMRYDKDDENLENLNAARELFRTSIDPRDEFWRTVAEAVNAHFTDENTADSIISQLQLAPGCDNNIKYENPNANENMPLIMDIFRKLHIDAEIYNIYTTHSIDFAGYWESEFGRLRLAYKNLYNCYMYESLKENENGADRFLEAKLQYFRINPQIINTLNTSAEKIFESTYGVTIHKLNSVDENLIDKIISEKRKAISDPQLSQLEQHFGKEHVEAYLLFGKAQELLDMMKKANEEPSIQPPEVKINLKRIAESVMKTQEIPCSYVETLAKTNSYTTTQHSSSRGQSWTFNPKTEKNKEVIGLIGEAVVYKLLKEDKNNTEVRWLSGNAKLAEAAVTGDDTLGYDISYVDKNGILQYVEVKASKSSDISFIMSKKEMTTACSNAANYEIIYVHIDADNNPDKISRLGHLFIFNRGEGLFSNPRFTVENHDYNIQAQIKVN